MSGERWRGAVRNEMPDKSTVLVKTCTLQDCAGHAALLVADTSPPKFGSRKYFCAISQVTISRTCDPVSHGASARSLCRSHGMWLGTGAPPMNKDGIPGFPQSSGCVDLRFA